MDNNFDKWLDNLIKKDGKIHKIMIKQIVDCLKLLSDTEKIQTKYTLEKVLKEEGKIIECLIYLGVGCLKILNEVNLEEDEEAM